MEIFGRHVDSEFIKLGLDVSQEELSSDLQKIRFDNQYDEAVTLVGDVLGAEGAAYITRADLKFGTDFSFIECQRCEDPLPESMKTPNAERWLLELFRMGDNRQALHVDPQRFLPDITVPPHTDKRNFYTPHNVIRWAKDDAKGTLYSNARVVMWSDGSATLHVGADCWEVMPSQDAAVNMLAVKTDVMVHGATGEEVLPDCWSQASHWDKHVRLVPVNDRNTLSLYVENEAKVRRARSEAQKVPLAVGGIPEPSPNAKGVPTRPMTLEEEVLAMARHRVEKEYAARLKSGNPMSLREQIEADVAAMNELNGDLESVARKLREEESQRRSRTQRPMPDVSAESDSDHLFAQPTLDINDMLPTLERTSRAQAQEEPAQAEEPTQDAEADSSRDKTAEAERAAPDTPVDTASGGEKRSVRAVALDVLTDAMAHAKDEALEMISATFHWISDDADLSATSITREMRKLAADVLGSYELQLPPELADSSPPV